jgi:hypothetical protein
MQRNASQKHKVEDKSQDLGDLAEESVDFLVVRARKRAVDWE